MEGEHGGFTVFKYYYAPGDGGPCKEAKTWLRGGVFRISADCEGEEYTYRALTRELKLLGRGQLSASDPGRQALLKYRRCTMPNHAITSQQLNAIKKLHLAFAEFDSKEVASRGGAVAEDKLRDLLQRQKDIAAKKEGFKSAFHVYEVETIARDIMLALEHPGYLEQVHLKKNVELVRASSEALKFLVEPEPNEGEKQ